MIKHPESVSSRSSCRVKRGCVAVCQMHRYAASPGLDSCYDDDDDA
ncbi:hypothetical protein [Pseudomonas capeferrum]